mgnify:FL=1
MEKTLRKIIADQKVGKNLPEGISEPKEFKRTSKHAPKEMSAKIPVSRFKVLKPPRADEDPEKGVFVKKPKKRDPRFDSLSGKFNKGLFEASYQFLDSYREQELQELKEALKMPEYENQKPQIKELINQKSQELHQAKEQKRLSQVKSSLIKEEKHKVKQGKKPYFIGKKLIKEEAHKAKLQELEAEGKLQKYLKKKRKRSEAKDSSKIRKLTKKHNSYN